MPPAANKRVEGDVPQPVKMVKDDACMDSWLFYPLADCPPDGSSSMDEPPYELSTGFLMV